MSQRHLFGTDYTELDPPVEWQDLSVDATINDSFTEANINTNVFTWVGRTARFINEDWIPL